MQTDLTPEDLNKLAEAFAILTRLGSQTMLAPGTHTPVWDDFVDVAHHNLALVLIRFDAGRWHGTGPWQWPDEFAPPIPTREFFDRLLGRAGHEHEQE